MILPREPEPGNGIVCIATGSFLALYVLRRSQYLSAPSQAPADIIFFDSRNTVDVTLAFESCVK